MPTHQNKQQMMWAIRRVGDLKGALCVMASKVMA
jgi:hypothetical protein